MIRRLAAASSALALALGLARTAHAVDPRSYEPALGAGALIGLETTYLAPPRRPHLAFSFTLAADELDSLSSRWVATVAAGTTLFRPLELAVALPVSAEGLGDVRALLRARLIGADISLALALGASFPTGADARYASDDGLVLDPKLVLDWRASSTSVVTVNVAYRARPSGVVDGVKLDDVLRFGVGGSFQAARAVAVLTELECQYLLGDVPADQRLPIEMRLGARVTFGPFALTAVAGTALNHGVGAPDLRFITAISWAQSVPPPPAPEPPPPLATSFPPFSPDFGDDPDVDADGITRADDRCPAEPETKNGFADDDGCPDTPPPPAPPPGASLATIEDGGDGGLIRLPSPIEFRSGSDVLLPATEPVIAEIARLLATRLDITRVRIEGHTDDEGDEEQNVDLAERRAAAVKRALVGRGIAPDRLLPKGFGTTRPILSGSDEASRAKNRRVELRVVARPDAGERP